MIRAFGWPIAIVGSLAMVMMFRMMVREASVCGYCDGDKLAAVWNGDAEAAAKRRGLAVAYVGIEDAEVGDFEAAMLRAVIGGIEGADKQSVFVSAVPAAMRFVYDPKFGGDAAFIAKANAALLKMKSTIRLQLLKRSGTR